MSDADAVIELAAIARAHGLRGELLLKPFNSQSELLFTLSELVLRRPDGSLERYTVESVHAHGASVLLALAEVQTREAAEALRGSTVCVRRADLPPLEDGEFYFVDLVGLRVVDEEGVPVGQVDEVLEYPAAVCFRVERPAGTLEIPHLPRYVASVDLERRTIVVRHLSELEEIAPKKKQL